MIEMLKYQANNCQVFMRRFDSTLNLVCAKNSQTTFYPQGEFYDHTETRKMFKYGTRCEFSKPTIFEKNNLWITRYFEKNI